MCSYADVLKSPPGSPIRTKLITGHHSSTHSGRTAAEAVLVDQCENDHTAIDDDVFQEEVTAISVQTPKEKKRNIKGTWLEALQQYSKCAKIDNPAMEDKMDTDSDFTLSSEEDEASEFSEDDDLSFITEVTDGSLRCGRNLNEAEVAEDLISFNSHFINVKSGEMEGAHKLARARKINAPPVGQKKCTGCGVKKSDPKTMTPAQRVRDFPNEPFSVDNGKLWCKCCSQELALKKDTIKNHIQSIRHEEQKAARIASEKRHGEIAAKTIAEVYAGKAQLGGSSLPISTQAHRISVCEAFLTDAIPFCVLRDPLGKLRQILEYNRAILPLCEVAQYIPRLLDTEIKTVQEELRGCQAYSYSFDGTTEVAELVCVVVRFIGKTSTIQHRVLSFKVLQRSLNADELAAHLLEVLALPAEAKRVHYNSRDGKCTIYFYF